MTTYLELGIAHILDLEGYDHMLFVAVLLAGVDPKRWKSILLLITAFTVGHSLTLAYTILDKALIPSEWVEFLIPVTIMLTALSNWSRQDGRLPLKALATVVFGLIHGMGFAGYLSSLLPKDMPIWQPLLLFNIGVEIGQIIIAGVLIGLFLSVRFITQNAVHTTQRIVSLAGIAVSLLLAIQKWPLS
jgi:hypothetical protein